ncbi:MAG: NAD(P)H-hydrate dehydratase [Bacteroidota bacterium]
MIPLFSAQQVRDADAYAINTLGIPSIVLMENAARSIYDAVQANQGDNLSNRIAGIVCGKGNNGGDGFALARQLMINDFEVRVVSLGAEEELKGDALTNFRILKNFINDQPQSKLYIYESIRDLSALEECSVIVDAMLGTGSRGDLTEPYKSIVEKLNTLNSFKVAVDLPTGLDLENSSGEIVFEADLTVTLSEYKTGLFYGKGYLNCGNIVKGSIGIGEEYYKKQAIKNYLIEPEDAFLNLPNKNLDIHKYSAGKVLVIAGSSKMPGAAVLTTNSVLRSGAGSCYLAFPGSIANVANQKVDSAIVMSYDDQSTGYLQEQNLKELDERIHWADVIALGPGIGREEETKKFVIELIQKYKGKNFVIDADALNAIGKDEYKKLNLKGKILTPHHKEFAELLGFELKHVEENLMQFGYSFTEETGCYLVLKGAPTIIFNPKGEAFINSAGNPGLAKFGTGDVLTGVISAFISQSHDIEESIISAVYIHSLAADLLLEEKSEYGYTSTDLSEKIPYAIKFIFNSFI